MSTHTQKIYTKMVMDTFDSQNGVFLHLNRKMQLNPSISSTPNDGQQLLIGPDIKSRQAFPITPDSP